MDHTDLLEILELLIAQINDNLSDTHCSDHDYVDDPEESGCCKYCGWYATYDMKQAGQTAIQVLEEMLEVVLSGTEEDVAEIKSRLHAFFVIADTSFLTFGSVQVSLN